MDLYSTPLLWHDLYVYIYHIILSIIFSIYPFSYCLIIVYYRISLYISLAGMEYIYHLSVLYTCKRILTWLWICSLLFIPYFSLLTVILHGLYRNNLSIWFIRRGVIIILNLNIFRWIIPLLFSISHSSLDNEVVFSTLLD